MTTIAELVELLKEGNISKEQMLERIYSSSFPSKPKPESTDPQTHKEFASSPTEHEIEIEFNPKDFEEFQRPAHIFDPSFSVITEGFLDRQSQWELRKSLNKEMLKEHKLKIEAKECTFQPKTNDMQPRSPEETLARLTKAKENSRLLKLKEEQDRKRLESEMEECTFHPEINRNACLSGSKYMSESPKRRSKVQEPNFVPKIKGPSKHMHSANEYLRQDPFERLSRPRESYQPEPEEPELSIKSATPVPEYTGCSFSTRPFYERQALYELMKQEKRETMEQLVSARPIINERSRKIVKKSFSQRNEEMIKKKNSEKQDPNPSSFQPRITNMAKMRRNRSSAEMSYGDSKKRLEKIEYLKETVEEKTRETFNPSAFQSKSYANVKSKLQIIEDPQSYIERLKTQQRKKDLESQILKEEKVRQELSECTYQPSIIDAPVYVKQIARNMAMIKAEISANAKPKKPDWR